MLTFEELVTISYMSMNQWTPVSGDEIYKSLAKKGYLVMLTNTVVKRCK